MSNLNKGKAMHKNEAGNNVNRTKEMVNERADKAEEFINSAREDVAQMWDRAGKKIKGGAIQAKDYAEDHPWHMAAVGTAVGFLLATLIFRKRD